MSDSENLTGHCYCGAVSFEMRGEPFRVVHCHCESCRRHSGAPMITAAGYKSADVVFTGRPLSKFSLNGSVSRGHCAECGSSMSYESDRNDYIFMNVGAFDEPEKLSPQLHTMYDEKVEWLKIDDILPHSKKLL